MSSKTTQRRQSAIHVINEYIFVNAAPAQNSSLPVIAFEA